MVKPDNYKNIDDSFETGFENIGNKELIHRLKTLRPISETESIKAEITRRLIDGIAEFNDNSSQQSKRIIKLTEWIIGLTFAMAFFALVNIGLLGYQIYTNVQQSEIQNTLTEEIITNTEEIIKEEKIQTDILRNELNLLWLWMVIGIVVVALVVIVFMTKEKKKISKVQ